MNNLASAAKASDWLKGAAEWGDYYERDKVVLAAGNGILTTGTVLARLAASGKYVPAATGTADGSQTAVAILFNDVVDTTAADAPAIAITRNATVAQGGLVYGPTITTAQLRAAVAAQLAANAEIIVRQSA